MEDYLFNQDLAKKNKAGDLGSVRNVQMIHRGLCSSMKGYDSRITTDSKKHDFQLQLGKQGGCDNELIVTVDLCLSMTAVVAFVLVDFVSGTFVLLIKIERYK